MVLLYNIEKDKLSELCITLLRLGLSFREVKSEEFSLPIGYLAGLEGFTNEPVDDESDFSDEMLIMCGLSSSDLNELIDSLRRQRIGIPLKAVLTQTNAAWSSVHLRSEIAAEHAAMKATSAKSALRRGMHKKRK